MNFSYVMGIDNIDKLKKENFEIQQFGNSFGVVFRMKKLIYLKNIFANH